MIDFQKEMNSSKEYLDYFAYKYYEKNRLRNQIFKYLIIFNGRIYQQPSTDPKISTNEP